jgi:hypothetical protein
VRFSTGEGVYVGILGSDATYVVTNVSKGRIVSIFRGVLSVITQKTKIHTFTAVNPEIWTLSSCPSRTFHVNLFTN